MSLPQPYPNADHTRLMRVVQDVSDLAFRVGTLNPTNDEHKETIRLITRWTDHTLRVAALGKRWWFLDNLASATIAAGQDMIDLKGHLDRVSAVYAPRRLHPVSLARITELRQRAASCNRPNAASECTHYALEAGRRLHLWPCPSASIPIALLYQRPIHIAIVPFEWEPIIFNGIVGMFGRHFDREQFSQDPAFFESRFNQQLRDARLESHDTIGISTWEDALDGTANATANSSSDTATEILVPASIMGVGFEMVLSTGDYLLVDNGTAPFGQQYYNEVLP